MLYDFCGFTFNQRHSSEMGLVRVSDGSRYEINLVPNFTDKVVDVPGSDEMYFFESLYSSKPFSINVAFDSVTETQLRMMRQVFNGKDVGELIFDETPYKAYIVKVAAPPQIKYICFDQKRVSSGRAVNMRVYKGEGTIQFIAYSPYAHSVKKFLGEYDREEYTNMSEWASSTGMIYNTATGVSGGEPVYNLTGTDTIRLFNPGDLPTDFKVWLPTENLNRSFSIQLGTNDVLNFDPILTPLSSSDVYICINTKTNLVEGCNGRLKTTGSIYNGYIRSGDFFKIPVYTDVETPLNLQVFYTNSGASGSPIFSDIEYNYLYY